MSLDVGKDAAQENSSRRAFVFFRSGGFEALGEPAVNGGEEIASPGAHAFLAQKICKVARYQKFDRPGVLAACNGERLLKQGLGF